MFDKVLANPTKSIRKRAQQLGISPGTVHRILKQDLHLLLYKIQLVQKLRPTGHANFKLYIISLL